MITMDYNGDSNKTEIQGEIQTFVVFANTMYWQQPNSTVIHVVSGKTKEIDRNISLSTQLTSLTNLGVMDTLQQSIGELYITYFKFLTFNGYNYFGVIIACKHATQFLISLLYQVDVR